MIKNNFKERRKKERIRQEIDEKWHEAQHSKCNKMT